ncbi:MAG: L-lactate dehydrogenase [Coprobacillus sp.]|nr:L-lactate dehydrogenase [Coprobacillus sp.]
MTSRNVVIIGDGMVGSTLAYTLMIGEAVTDISIVDINKNKAEGDVLDLIHGMSFVSPKSIKAGDYSDVREAHIAVITAGVAQKEGESRMDLLKRNIKVFDSIIEGIKPYVHDDLIVLVVTNPVDVLAYYTYKKLGLPASHVIGSGTVLDTARLKSVIASETSVDPRDVQAFILGEHGDSEIAAWSATNIAGVPLDKFCAQCHWKVNEANSKLNELYLKVKNAAYEIISKKGATYYAVGLSVAKIIEAILNDQNSVLTISTYITDQFDGEIYDLYFSLPVIVNSDGVKEVLKLDYSMDEYKGLINSGRVIKKEISDLNIGL